MYGILNMYIEYNEVLSLKPYLIFLFLLLHYLPFLLELFNNYCPQYKEAFDLYTLFPLFFVLNGITLLTISNTFLI